MKEAKAKFKKKKQNRKRWLLTLSLFFAAVLYFNWSFTDKAKTKKALVSLPHSEIFLSESCSYILGGHTVPSLSSFFKNYQSKVVRIPDDPIFEIIFSDTTGFCRVYVEDGLVIGRHFRSYALSNRVTQY